MYTDALELDTEYFQAIMNTPGYEAAFKARLAVRRMRERILESMGLPEDTFLQIPADWMHKVPAPKQTVVEPLEVRWTFRARIARWVHRVSA